MAESLTTMSYEDKTTLPLDYVPLTPGTDVLPDTLGFIPRAIYCGADGDLVVRFEGSDTDRTLPVVKGLMVLGPARQVKSGTDCSPFAVK